MAKTKHKKVRSRVAPVHRMPGPMCQVHRPRPMDSGTMCLAPSPTPGIGPDDIGACWDDSVHVPDPMESAMERIFAAVDRVAELHGSGVAIRINMAQPIVLRESDHASGLETYVVAKFETADQRTWWEKWNSAVLDCGSAALGVGTVAVTALAEIPSGGSATPLVIWSSAFAVASTAQCSMAVAKETSGAFQEFVQGPDGYMVDVADVVLDVISVAGGIKGAVTAVRSGSKLLQTSKYAAQLEKLPKGQLLKTVEKLERAEKDLTYFHELFQRTLKAGKVADPAARKISSNLLKRALPLITGQLKMEKLDGLIAAVDGVVSVLSSAGGGSGPRNFGVVRFLALEIRQAALNAVESEQAR